jgi:hypothetical protein
MAKIKCELAGFARYIEERFLDCAARLVRRSEPGRKIRAAPLGMPVWAFFAEGL